MQPKESFIEPSSMHRAQRLLQAGIIAISGTTSMAVQALAQEREVVEHRLQKSTQELFNAFFNAHLKYGSQHPQTREQCEQFCRRGQEAAAILARELEQEPRSPAGMAFHITCCSLVTDMAKRDPAVLQLLLSRTPEANLYAREIALYPRILGNAGLVRPVFTVYASAHDRVLPGGKSDEIAITQLKETMIRITLNPDVVREEWCKPLLQALSPEPLRRHVQISAQQVQLGESSAYVLLQSPPGMQAVTGMLSSRNASESTAKMALKAARTFIKDAGKGLVARNEAEKAELARWNAFFDALQLQVSIVPEVRALRAEFEANLPDTLRKKKDSQ